MYNFYCDPNKKDEEKLLFVKHLLPRYLNGIPDTEFLALLKCGDYIDKKSHPAAIVETGCGASTIALAYLAAKYDMGLFNFDPNELKQLEIKQVIANMPFDYITIHQMLSKTTFIPTSSSDQYLGIDAIFEEYDRFIVMAFLDSEHTTQNLDLELKLILRQKLAKNVVIAIDDADLNYRYANTGLINIRRRKLDLTPIMLYNNESNTFKETTIDAITHFCNCSNSKFNWHIIGNIIDFYNDRIDCDDTTFYYSMDKATMVANNMESASKNQSRFLPIRLVRK